MGLLLSSLQKEVLLFTWVGTGDMAARNGGSTANSLLPTSDPGGGEDGPWQSSSWDGLSGNRLATAGATAASIFDRVSGFRSAGRKTLANASSGSKLSYNS